MKMFTKVIFIWALLSLPFFLMSCGGSGLTEAADSVTPVADNDEIPTTPTTNPTDEIENDAVNDASSFANESVETEPESTQESAQSAYDDLDLQVSIDSLPLAATAGEAVEVTYTLTNNTDFEGSVQTEIRIHDETVEETAFTPKNNWARPLRTSEKFQSFCTVRNPCTTMSAVDVNLSPWAEKTWTTSVVLPATLNGTYHFVVRVMDESGEIFYARAYTSLSVTQGAETDLGTEETNDADNDALEDENAEDTADAEEEAEDNVEDESADDEVLEDEPVDESQVDLTAGANLFSASCAGCHASDGTGASGPDLTTRISGMSDAAIEDQIRNGGSSMPAVGASFTEEEMANIIAFLKTL